MSNDYIPDPDASFHGWQNNFFVELGSGTRIARLGIPQAKVTALEGLQGQWEDAWHLASQPATRTPLAVEEKTRIRGLYEDFLRALVRQHITPNDAATDADRVALGLPIHKKTRMPIPPPVTHPVAEQRGNQPGLVELHFRDEEGEHRGKPGQAHGAEIAYDVRETPPGDPGELAHSEIDTRSPFKKQFRADQRGLKMWYALRWESPTGGKGPWSPIAFVVIP
ncbi:hypothetical protein OpiT1DRAFT_05163 [Opitutaceae bacterium TAV1]|nr:hypothetical protein OpiT1DRAFT_05163 [Opitutaceae bacterium TAV1]